MNGLIERFLLSQKAENASPNTIRAYRADLEGLGKFQAQTKRADMLNRETVRAFLAQTVEGGQQRATTKRKLYAVKSFARWLVQEGILTDDDFSRIVHLRSPKVPTTLPDIPSEQQVQDLLGGDFPTAFPERDRLICELLYGVGLRVSEVAHIRLDDFRPEQNALLIHGKGGPYGKAAKHRVVPLNPNVQSALDTYLVARVKMVKKLKVETDALFFGLRNSKGESISVRSVARMLASITDLRKLPRLHPHLLRHACATHLLDNGCPLDVISKILGHDNIDITAYYAQVSTRLMMKTYNAAHPHARPSR
jgi:site-specific recombinase XerD